MNNSKEESGRKTRLAYDREEEADWNRGRQSYGDTFGSRTYGERVGNYTSINSNKEDLLISQLKSQLFELNFSEKTLASLSSKYKSLENEFIILNEQKPLINYEDSAQTRSSAKIVAEIRTELDNLGSTIKERTALNSRLASDIAKMIKDLEMQNNEITSLKKALNENFDNNIYLNEERRRIESDFHEQKQRKTESLEVVERLTDENIFIQKQIQELEFEIRKAESDGYAFNHQSEESFNNTSYFKSQMRVNQEQSSFNQRQLDEVNFSLSKLEARYDDMALRNEKLKGDLNTLRMINQKESFTKTENEEKNKELDGKLLGKENELRNYLYAVEESKNQKERYNQEKKSMMLELDKLNAHITNLKENNKTLTMMLDVISRQDEHVNEKLKKLESVDQQLKNSLSDLDTASSQLSTI